MPKLIKFNAPINLENFQLIIPSVSVGNVPQLTVDIIISSCNLKKVGLIWHPDIISSVGSDPYCEGSTDTCTACELYANEELKLCAIQIRSGITSTSFFQALAEDIESLQLLEIIILTSAHSCEMHDIKSNPFRYYSINQPNNIFSEKLQPLEEEKMMNNGSGFATNLCKVLSKSLKCTIVIKYTSEGDNRPDAIMFLNLLRSTITNLSKCDDKLDFPISWKYVYGSPPPIEIY